MHPNPPKKPNHPPHPNHSLENVKKQVVAGFIIFRRMEDGLKYLLLYRRGNYWNFPKGHFEQGENAMSTAIREGEEETGLKKTELKIVPNFKTYVRFFFDRGEKRIFDTVILYLAETRQTEVRISPREHSGYAWFLYPDAQRILGRYQGTKRALKQAHDFLRTKHPQTPHQHSPRQGDHLSHFSPPGGPPPGLPGGR